MSIDPSSSAVGVAVLCGLDARELVDAVLLKPSEAAKALPAMPDWLLTHLRLPDLRHAWKIRTLMRDVVDLVQQYEPRAIVIEIPSGKFGSGAKRGARGGLTTYGLAAGAMWGELQSLRPNAVIPVTERQWTRSRGDKIRHQAAIAATYPQYAAAADPGADVADAIGLGRWWLQMTVDKQPVHAR